MILNEDAAEVRMEGHRPRRTPYYAKRIAGNAPLTVKGIKRIVVEALKDDSERDLALCNRLVRDCFERVDYSEGRLAVKEKRKPSSRADDCGREDISGERM